MDAQTNSRQSKVSTTYPREKSSNKWRVKSSRQANQSHLRSNIGRKSLGTLTQFVGLITNKPMRIEFGVKYWDILSSKMLRLKTWTSWIFALDGEDSYSMLLYNRSWSFIATTESISICLAKKGSNNWQGKLKFVGRKSLKWDFSKEISSSSSLRKNTHWSLHLGAWDFSRAIRSRKSCQISPMRWIWMDTIFWKNKSVMTAEIEKGSTNTPFIPKKLIIDYSKRLISNLRSYTSENGVTMTKDGSNFLKFGGCLLQSA